MKNAEELSKRIGQLLIGGFDGQTPPDDFTELIKDGKVGGAILFRRNLGTLEQTCELVRALRTTSAPQPLLMAIDQEGGRVERLKAPFPELPPMRKFGECGRKSVAFQAGQVLARALSAMGFHQNYAPVLDVDSNPKNPIIGDRSFSSDPNKVARLGAALIEGMQSSGVAACGKHFPGHGDTNLDSHLELPRLPHKLERLHGLELIPFVAAARTGVAAIMTAHILFEALDSEHPATLSENVLEPLLRTELRYRGVIVSDDLEMKAVSDHYGVEDAAVRAIRAGCDQLLICSQPELIERAHRALIQAVETGVLSASRVEEAARRVQDLKDRYVVGKPAPVQGDVSEHLPSAMHAQLLDALEQPRISSLRSGEGVVEFEFEGDPEVELELDD